MAAGVSRQGRVSLKDFELQGVRDTGRKIGDGSYATVVELDFHGLKCVGKKLHGLLYNTANPMERATMLTRFAGECTLLSRLHHPCIVQFLGVYFESGSQLPVMVMEYLHSTLSACIDKYGILPPEILYGIFRDVILGLRYLHEHSPSIIHRDLSANNVLLDTNMSAKISDLGVAKILNLNPAQMGLMTQTQTPGTPCYMPPEAMIARPKYTNKVDIFSFGVMMVHMLSGEWPIPGEVFRPDPNNPDLIVPVPEVDRRNEYLQKIDQSNPLLGLIRQCLSNNPQSRPEAVDILGQVGAVISQYPPSLKNRVELIQQIQGQGEDRVVTALREEIQTNSQESEARYKELMSKHRDIEALRDELAAKNTMIASKERQISSKQKEIDMKQKEIETKARELSSLTAEIQSLKEENTQQRSENSLLRQQLERQSISHPKTASFEPNPLRPQTKLQWKRSAELPAKVSVAQSVLVGHKVYVGSGNRDDNDNDSLFRIFEYDPQRDDWATLPPCPTSLFGLALFRGNLVTVGGDTPEDITVSTLYCYKERSQEWKEYLQPMPTARYSVSVVATQSAIIACGGILSTNKNTAAVEVYTNETDHWHTADSLPSRYYQMKTVTIGDTCYLLGGMDNSDKPCKTVLCASISSLVESATHTRKVPSLFKKSTWKTIQDTPQLHSAVVNVSGSLLAIGGCNKDFQNSSDVHIFRHSTNSWVRMPFGGLPLAVSGLTAIQLPDTRLLISGGDDPTDFITKQAFIGTITDS